MRWTCYPHTARPPPLSSLPNNFLPYKLAYASVLRLELQRSWLRLLTPVYRPSDIYIHVHGRAMQTHLVVISR